MNTRRGLTLVEMSMIAIAIVIGLGLLLPAVQSARINSRRVNCANNLRNISLAMLAFEQAHQKFPGYLNTLHPESLNAKTVGYQIMLLPYLERNDLWRFYDNDAISAEEASSSTNVYISTFNCPSNPSNEFKENGISNSYVVNGGAASSDGTKYENIADGIFTDQSAGSQIQPVSLEYVVDRDGSDRTILLTENLQAWRWQLADNAGRPVQSTPPTSEARNDALFHHIFVWFDTKTPSDRNYINGDINDTINPIPFPSTDIQSARPSSNHQDGANATSCDGSVRFIHEDIDYQLFIDLMTPNGVQATGRGLAMSKGMPYPPCGGKKW